MLGGVTVTLVFLGKEPEIPMGRFPTGTIMCLYKANRPLTPSVTTVQFNEDGPDFS